MPNATAQVAVTMGDAPQGPAKVNGAPRSGTPEAEAYVAQVLGRIEASRQQICNRFISLEDMQAFAVKTGLNSLTEKIHQENNAAQRSTRKPAATKTKKTKKKRVRVSI